jgi:cytochrome P450
MTGERGRQGDHPMNVDRDLFSELADAINPYPILHSLRRADPVYFVASHRLWFVSAHEHVMRLLHDPDNVSPDGRIWESYVAPDEGTFMRWMADHGMSTLSVGQHQRLRNLAAAAFSPRAIARMSAQMKQLVATLAAPLCQGDDAVIDLFARFVNVVPTAAITEITGIRPQDRGYFSQVVRAMLEAAIPFAADSGDERAERSFAELAGWVRQALVLRRSEPSDDLLTDLSSTSLDELRPSEDDIVLLLCSIIAAGVVTVASTATAMIRVALERPDLMQAVRADPQLAVRSIDELIRYAAGPSGPVRFARQNFVLADKHIRKGQMLMLSSGGACRDPSVYDDPDTLRLDRSVVNLPVFGRGPHYCLGATLARHQLAYMLAALADVLPSGARMRQDRLLFGRVGLFRRLLNLPVEIDREFGAVHGQPL